MNKNALFENIKLQFKNICNQLEQIQNLENVNSSFQIYNIYFQMLNLIMQMMNFGKMLPFDMNDANLQEQILNCRIQIRNLSMQNYYMNNMGIQKNSMKQMKQIPKMSNILIQEFNDCNQDQFLFHIGSKFELENNDLYNWKVIMQGPIGTPYEDGFFTLKVIFPFNFPKYGPKIRFENKIYHMNVGDENLDEKEKNCGYICHPHLNEWCTTGKVHEIPYYNVREAIYDIYDLLYKPINMCLHYKGMAELYLNNRQKFDEEVRNFVKKYAAEPDTPFKKRNRQF